ncbi:MAG: TolC family protein [Alistipes senegalensis]|nr:TolC family protein [Alistipes senegalensis]
MNKKYIFITCCAVLFAVSSASAQPSLRLSQTKCRELALSHSEDLQKSDNALRQAELDRKIARTAFLPNVEGSATGAYMFPDMDMLGMELRMRGTYMAGVSLTQPVYTGGKIRTGHRLARIGEEVAVEQHRMTRMDVLVEADNAYWTYIAVERKVRMLESYHAQMDTLYRQTETALAAGMATGNDLLRIEAKRSEIDYQLQKVRNGADLCRMSLCRVVGAEFDTPIEPTDTAIVVSEPSRLAADIEHRPELHLLEKQVTAQKEQIRMARADMLPTVGLGVNYMYYGNIKLRSMVDAGGGTMVPYTQEFRDGMGMAMLSVKIPIFHWGESRKKVRKAQYELRNAELDLQKNTRLLSIEVQQAIRNVQDGFRLIRTAETGLQQADENLRVMRDRYAASMSPLTDLLDAQSQWQQAESNLIEARTQYKIYETEYLRATGRLE